MTLTAGLIANVSRDPDVVWIMVWPCRMLQIPVRNVDEFEGKTGRTVKIEIEETQEG